MPSLSRNMTFGSQKPRRFVPFLEALEQRSLLAGIGHSHGPVQVVEVAEPTPAPPAIVETSASAAKAVDRPSTTDERVAIAESAAQLAESDLSLTNALTAATFQSQTTAQSGLVIALAAAEHGSHSQSAVEAPLQAHADHAAAMVVPGAVAAVAIQAHGHADNLPDTTRAAQFVHSQGESSPLQSDLASDSHHDKDEDQPSAANQKFAPKRCTMKYTSKEVYRDVSGDRKCDCPQKAAAEASSRERDAAEDEPSEFSPILASAGVVDCLPCQFDAATNAAICRIATGPLSEMAESSPCEAQRPANDSWAAGVTSFYEGLQLVGWTLVGTSVMAVSLAAKRTTQPQDDRERTSALDQFFGHLGLERLPR